MTAQEQQLLKDLTDRVNSTVLQEKDTDAEQMINNALGRNPDSHYIMAQTILVQQYALDQAKKQLDDAKQQLEDAQQQLEHARQQAQQPQKHTSFLGSLLGHDDPQPPPPPMQNQAQYQPVQNYNPPPPQYGQPQYAQPQYAQSMAYGAPQAQGGGFLRSAMTTAAGVAAGAVAFEGIESLMHGFDQHAGYGAGSFGMGGMGGGQPREEIINNYYNDAPGERGEHGRDLTDRFADAGDQPSSDIEDRRDDDRSNFADTGDVTDAGSFDDNSDSSTSDDFSDSGTDSSDDNS